MADGKNLLRHTIDEKKQSTALPPWGESPWFVANMTSGYTHPYS
jgi:hypothetical protein